jgi:anti-anti-sigma regulatory factor
VSELTFMDNSGINTLAIAKQRMAANRNDLILARPHE